MLASSEASLASVDGPALDFLVTHRRRQALAATAPVANPPHFD